MANRKVQIDQGSQRNDEPQFPSDGLRGWIEGVATGPTDAAQPLPATIHRRHTEQMYELADIFASIFDALHGAPDDAIATTGEAA